jgi:hypothetical protein
MSGGYLIMNLSDETGTEGRIPLHTESSPIEEESVLDPVLLW